MPLQLREYQKNDFIALKNIIRKTWRYDEFSGPKTASRLADVFLSSCLTNYTFSRVAVLNGKPVGHYSGKGYRASHVSASEQIPAASGRSVALSHQRGPGRIQNF